MSEQVNENPKSNTRKEFEAIIERLFEQAVKEITNADTKSEVVNETKLDVGYIQEKIGDVTPQTDAERYKNALIALRCVIHPGKDIPSSNELLKLCAYMAQKLSTATRIIDGVLDGSVNVEIVTL